MIDFTSLQVSLKQILKPQKGFNILFIFFTLG